MKEDKYTIKTKTFSKIFLKFIIITFLLVHFVLTLLYVSPANPLRNTIEPLLNGTVGVYFPQDWNLFAPVPRTADLGLLVRPLSENEFKVAQTRGLPRDGWYNLSAPLWTQFQKNRFSAYNRLGRPVDQAIVHYLTRPQQQSVQIMVKAASVFCQDTGQSQARFVALVIYEKPGKLWSDRDTTKPRMVRTSLVGIYPVDKNVAKMNMYQMGAEYDYFP